MKKTLKIFAIGVSIILIALFALNLVTKLDLKTEVVFDAPKEKVWEVLTDTDKYTEWNPFITSIKGEMKQGAQITNVIFNQGKETTLPPLVITVFERYERLEWMGSGLGVLFQGNRYFKITETKEGKTKMLHGEKFSGLLSGIIMRTIGKDTHANFELMNDAMKKRVEKE